MAVLGFQDFMLPILKVLKNGRERPIREIKELVDDAVGLADQDHKALLPSGSQPVLDRRAEWAGSCLKKGGLIESKNRGYFAISESGLGALERNPEQITIGILKQFEEFNDLVSNLNSSGNSESSTQGAEDASVQNPEEIIEALFGHLNTDLASEVLKRVKDSSRHPLSSSWSTHRSRWATAAPESKLGKRRVLLATKSLMASSRKTVSASTSSTLRQSASRPRVAEVHRGAPGATCQEGHLPDRESAQRIESETDDTKVISGELQKELDSAKTASLEDRRELSQVEPEIRGRHE